MLVKAGTSQFQFSQAHKAFARLANTKCVVLGTNCIIAMVRLLYHGPVAPNVSQLSVCAITQTSCCRILFSDIEYKK